MGNYRFVVLTNPTEGKEDEFNEWYNETHLKDVLQVPGVISGQRFKVHRPSLSPNQDPSHDYLAIYEVETDDIAATLADLRSRPNTPAMVMSDAIDLAASSSLIYETLTPRMVPE